MGDKMLKIHLEMVTSGNHEDKADSNVFLLHILRLMQTADDQLCVQWISHVERLFHIVMFNVNESSLEEMKSPQYFDHSHLFQLVQLCQLMFANKQRTVSEQDILHHFANMLRLEMAD